jgi:hypothetical protein
LVNLFYFYLLVSICAALKHALPYAECECKAQRKAGKVCGQRCPKGGKACLGLDK